MMFQVGFVVDNPPALVAHTAPRDGWASCVPDLKAFPSSAHAGVMHLPIVGAKGVAPGAHAVTDHERTSGIGAGRYGHARRCCSAE